MPLRGITHALAQVPRVEPFEDAIDRQQLQLRHDELDREGQAIQAVHQIPDRPRVLGCQREVGSHGHGAFDEEMHRLGREQRCDVIVDIHLVEGRDR